MGANRTGGQGFPGPAGGSRRGLLGVKSPLDPPMWPALVKYLTATSHSYAYGCTTALPYYLTALPGDPCRIRGVLGRGASVILWP